MFKIIDDCSLDCLEATTTCLASNCFMVDRFGNLTAQSGQGQRRRKLAHGYAL